MGFVRRGEVVRHPHEDVEFIEPRGKAGDGCYLVAVAAEQIGQNRSTVDAAARFAAAAAAIDRRQRFVAPASQHRAGDNQNYGQSDAGQRQPDAAGIRLVV